MTRKRSNPPFSDAELAAAAHSAADSLFKEMRGVTVYEPPFQPPKPSATKAPKPPIKPNTAKPRSKSLPDGMSPVTAYVRSLDGDYRTTQEVADVLGVSPQLVRKLARQRATQAPSFVAPFGKIRVHLYTNEDIDSLRAYLALRRQVMRRDEVDPLPEPEHLRGTHG